MKTLQVITAGVRKLVVTAAKGDPDFDLSLLGVPESLHERLPHEAFYPSSFNPDARTVWLELLNDDNYLADRRTVRASEVWLFTLKLFMARCRDHNIDPFSNRTDATINNDVRGVLFHRRNSLVRYLNRNRLFDYIKPVPMTDKHRYEYLPSGAVRIVASLQFQMEDAEGLIALLRSPKFKMVRCVAGGFERNLTGGMFVKVIKMKRKTAVLQWMLTLHPPFYIPPTVVNRKDRHVWLDREFFLPTIRGHRFEGLPRRIKF